MTIFVVFSNLSLAGSSLNLTIWESLNKDKTLFIKDRKEINDEGLYNDMDFLKLSTFRTQVTG